MDDTRIPEINISTFMSVLLLAHSDTLFPFTVEVIASDVGCYRWKSPPPI